MKLVVGRSPKKAKLKANSEKERIKIWHDHFKELLGKPTSISTHNNIGIYLKDQTKILLK